MRQRGIKALVSLGFLVIFAGCANINGTPQGSGSGSSSVQGPTIGAPSPSSPSPAGPLPAPPTVDDTGHPVDPAVLQLVRQIYTAAVQSDYSTLEALLSKACLGSNARFQAQAQLWHQNGELLVLRKLLLTHGSPTDGYTYPGFALAGWHTSYDYEDSALLDFAAPPKPTSDASSYKGPRMVVTLTQAGSLPMWCGIQNGY